MHEQFKDDSSILKVVDRFLLTVCPICKALFDDQEACEAHIKNICVPRQMSLCMYFGEPETTTPVFETYSSLEAEKKERHNHLVQNLKQISKHIISTSFSSVGPSSGTNAESGANNANEAETIKKLDRFTALIISETDTDFSVPTPPTPPRMGSPFSSNASTVAAVLTSSNASTVPYASNQGDVIATSGDVMETNHDQADKAPPRQRGGETGRSGAVKQRPTKHQKRREFYNESKEGVREYRQDDRTTGSGHSDHDDSDDNDKDGDCESYVSDASVDADKDESRSDGGRKRDQGAREEDEEGEREKGRRREKTKEREDKGENEERYESGHDGDERDERMDRQTDRRVREERRIKGSSSRHNTAHTKGKSAMSARRRLDFEREGEDYDSYEEVPVGRSSRTARMHTSNVFRLSKSAKPKKTRHRVYLESDESRSPSPPPTPSPSKKRREVVRVARPNPKRREYYVVSGSDTE